MALHPVSLSNDGKQARHILFIGIGGGADIFGSLPLLYHIRTQSPETKTTLANLTFVDLDTLQQACETGKAKRVQEWVFEIQPDKQPDEQEDTTCYFPERWLAMQINQPVFAIVPYDKNVLSTQNDPSINELSSFFENLIRERNIDEIFYVDGGCDSLLTGSEMGLGTPTEDLFTMKCVEYAASKFDCLGQRQRIERSLILVGLDCDTAHGVQLADLEARLLCLKPRWIDKMNLKRPEIQRYVETVLLCNPEHSIIHSLVVGALAGLRGYQVPPWIRKRLKKLLVPITDRMANMFCYKAEDIFEQCLYWNDIDVKMNSHDLDNLICKRHEEEHFSAVLLPLVHFKKSVDLCFEYLGVVLF